MPKRARPLSARTLNAVRPSDKPVELSDGYVPGLRVRILPYGEKSWSLNIRDSNGKRGRFHVGTGLGLAEARLKAEQMRRDIKEGKNPTAQKRAARQRATDARNGVGTSAHSLRGILPPDPDRSANGARRTKDYSEPSSNRSWNSRCLICSALLCSLLPTTGGVQNRHRWPCGCFGPASSGRKNAA
jgi:hypothetical protein